MWMPRIKNQMFSSEQLNDLRVDRIIQMEIFETREDNDQLIEKTIEARARHRECN